ncbi:MAG: helix-turn-helix domain-containing protein [Prevotellaceae bacterium]|jgi:adenylate kinase|nr:helix-turn-helix domain-containing protein [Prevotellaceae bacterium]
MNHLSTNPQLELANNLLEYTGTHLFLTGKAGTGKTTFLRNLQQHSPKRMVVVAPTGVAAINAGGVTIHSFFQLNFAPFVPGTKMSREFFRFNKEKINIIRSLDLLVIDEISMVRADLLDAVDYVLRSFRRKETPFGGVQLLMIGDMQQLAPVIKDDEWRLLSHYYESLFFFNSHALKKTLYACVELKTVYRQSDEAFINMLNRIRENKIDNDLLHELNKRYQPNFNPSNEEGYIILTTHNAQAQRINSEKLKKLNEKSFIYEAKITGNFPEYSFPTDARLELKKGTQVMFVKNDPLPDKRYYNGKIGIITRIDDNRIEVQGENDLSPIVVEKLEWNNIKYIINPESKELEEHTEGVFEQYPLKTAWAITVHKSQGLTFEKAIIDASDSFAHGQVYVALSRCKTLEGMVLSSLVTTGSVIRSQDIDTFIHYAEEKEPNEQAFLNLRKTYFAEMLFDQFSYSEIQTAFFTMRRLLDEYFWNLYPELTAQYKQTETILRSEILQVSEQFRIQLQQLLTETEQPEENLFLQERIKKAAVYFSEKTSFVLLELLNKTVVDTDSKEIRKKVNDAFLFLQTEIRKKQKTLEVCQTGFSVPAYLNAKAKAAIEDEETPKGKKKEKTSKESLPKASVPKDILHPELYAQIRSWRSKLALEQNVPAYIILSQMALIGVTNLLPQDSAQLIQIPGIGKMTLARYGEEILQMVQQGIRQYGYEVTEQTLAYETIQPKEKELKPNTNEQSFLLFEQGKSIEEIAKERSYAVSTIESHLLPYVKNGDIPLEKLVDPDKIKAIKNVLQQKTDATTLTEIKEALGDDYSWADIRFVKAVQ